MNEQEYGVDAAMFNGRVSLELSHYERVIKDLLVTFPLPPSSGLVQQTINGGQMSSRGFEGGLSIVPISTKNIDWTLRTTYQRNVQSVDNLLVPAFAVTGSFGSSYGRNRIQTGTRPTYIWGNVPYSCINTTDASGVVTNKPVRWSCLPPINPVMRRSPVAPFAIDVADASPVGQTSFNTFRYKAFRSRHCSTAGGFTSDMTKNTWTGGTRTSMKTLTAGTRSARRTTTSPPANIATYIDNGTFLLREINVSRASSGPSKLRSRNARLRAGFTG